MKALYLFLTATFVGTAMAFSQGEVRVSVDFFHDSLQTNGDWREIGDLGYCWQPRDVDRAWRPYSDGRWLYTDAGWTWDSDEPYSWAVYHYGRWARVDGVGWVWVPGTEWGPAWVSWRRTPTQVGWAPLSPEARFDRSVGFDSRVDADYDIGPTNYNFVAVRDFGAPRLREVLIDPRENITIFSQSTNITRITYVNDVVYNGGPQYDAITRESAQAIPRLKLERQPASGGGAVRGDQLQSRVEGGSLRVTAIPFDARPATAPRKVVAKVPTAAVDHGWNNAGPPAEVAKVRARIKSDAATPGGLPGSKTEATVQVPVASTPPNGKLPKKRSTDTDRNAVPTTPIAREGTPPGKPATAESTSPRISPPPAQETTPANPSKKGRNKGSETPRPATAAPPGEAENGRPPNHFERKPNVPPTVVETPPLPTHAGKGDAPVKPEPAGTREFERNAPKVPESHPPTKKPEAHEQVTPAATQPAKPKAKDKGKDEKKDAPKPEGTPQ